MRRTEKEIGRAEIDAIIRRSQVCRLGLSDQGEPYVVPLCFGYDGQALIENLTGNQSKRE
jgi:nitroimidazol reductase NimA-like FMN-containing flavoprotein (pyridoxamine 5'-phosphate oxidase superfamily)